MSFTWYHECMKDDQVRLHSSTLATLDGSSNTILQVLESSSEQEVYHSTKAISSEPWWRGEANFPTRQPDALDHATPAWMRLTSEASKPNALSASLDEYSVRISPSDEWMCIGNSHETAAWLSEQCGVAVSPDAVSGAFRKKCRIRRTWWLNRKRSNGE